MHEAKFEIGKLFLQSLRFCPHFCLLFQIKMAFHKTLRLRSLVSISRPLTHRNLGILSHPQKHDTKIKHISQVVEELTRKYLNFSTLLLTFYFNIRYFRISYWWNSLRSCFISKETRRITQIYAI